MLLYDYSYCKAPLIDRLRLRDQEGDREFIGNQRGGHREHRTPPIGQLWGQVHSLVEIIGSLTRVA